MSQRQQQPRIANPNEAETFHLWVFSDAHVATDKAVSAAIRNGMEFTPPAAYPEFSRRRCANPRMAATSVVRRSAGTSRSISAIMPGSGICPMTSRGVRWRGNTAF